MAAINAPYLVILYLILYLTFFLATFRDPFLAGPLPIRVLATALTTTAVDVK